MPGKVGAPSFVRRLNCFACPQEILQRAVSSEEPRDRNVSSRGQDKTTLKELLDTLKVLQEEPEGLPQPKFYRKEKYAWINEVK